jgi:hypothetical protein
MKSSGMMSSKKSSSHSGIISKMSNVNEVDKTFEERNLSEHEEEKGGFGPDGNALMMMGEDDMGGNDEEDKRAQMLISKEEAENALFKRLF